MHAWRARENGIQTGGRGGRRRNLAVERDGNLVEVHIRLAVGSGRAIYGERLWAGLAEEIIEVVVVGAGTVVVAQKIYATESVVDGVGRVWRHERPGRVRGCIPRNRCIAGDAGSCVRGIDVSIG